MITTRRLAKNGGPRTTDHGPRTRPGVTLTETLVAIFVCGLGLMALMTLFPIGALNMAQARKDARTAHAAGNGAGLLRMRWRVSLENGLTGLAFDAALNNPNNIPVYLDPIGYYGYPSGTAVGNPPCGIPRVTLQALDTSPTRTTAIIRWFTLLDDITFAKSGKPFYTGAPGVNVQRDAKYSWAYMIRGLKGVRKDPAGQVVPAADPRALEFSVVVYSGRSVGTLKLSPNLLPQGESTLSGVLQGPKQVSVSYAGARPNIRKGGWIMQAPEGYFYRVVQLTDAGTGALDIEVQTPWRNWQDVLTGRAAANSTIVIMDKVVEVFERSTLE